MLLKNGSSLDMLNRLKSFYHMTLLSFSGYCCVISNVMTTCNITLLAGTSHDESVTTMRIFIEIKKNFEAI